MHTPAAALAWELWRRHRARLMTIICLILAFTLFYPKLCQVAGFNPNSADALDEIARKFALSMGAAPMPLRVVQMLFILFLACGPSVTMLLSLLFVMWMFTFTEFDPKTRDPMAFPARLFTLPISTPFLFWSLTLGGLAAVVVLYQSWVHLVRLPHINIFAAYQNCFGWITVLAMAQGTVWSLAAWPITRALLLSAVLFGFMCSPARRDILESPIVMLPLFVLGVVMAHAGLQKMRHGQWQGLASKWPFAGRASRSSMRPARFASPAMAQLWFEWRRFARPLCFYVAVLALVPVGIHVLVRFVAGLGPLQNETLSGFVLCLIAIPLLLHFCFAISPPQGDLTFLMIRPMTNGNMVMATLKAAGISTVISWMLVLAALCAMPLLGDFQAAEQGIAASPQWRTIGWLGLVLLTWRLIAVNLCFTLSGNPRLAALPATLMLLGLWPVCVILSWLAHISGYWNSFWRLVPALLVCLVALKFLLALLAFQVCLKRSLLSPSALRAYLFVWILLVAALVMPAVILFHDQEWIVALSLGLVLLVPLARIGLCPITLAGRRHS